MCLHRGALVVVGRGAEPGVRFGGVRLYCGSAQTVIEIRFEWSFAPLGSSHQPSIRYCPVTRISKIEPIGICVSVSAPGARVTSIRSVLRDGLSSSPPK